MTGETCRRGNVISDRESGGHYPLSRYDQYYRSWEYGARKCDSRVTVPMETCDRIRTPVSWTSSIPAITHGPRSSTNIDAAKGRKTTSPENSYVPENEISSSEEFRIVF